VGAGVVDVALTTPENLEREMEEEERIIGAQHPLYSHHILEKVAKSHTDSNVYRILD
jgi:hypothetical protein